MFPQVGAMLKSWARVFLAAFLAVILAELTGEPPVTVDWQGAAIAGAVAVLPVVMRWLDSSDTAYGRGAVDADA